MNVHVRPVSFVAACLLVIMSAPSRASTLYERMGGEAVLRTAVDRFTDIVIADDRINFTFAETDLGKFKQLLYEQLCSLAGGPCHYTGRDMHEAHAKLDITTAEFDALAEDLYLGLGKAGVSYRLQNQLMALLAPMKREIVKHRHSAETAPNATGDNRRD